MHCRLRTVEPLPNIDNAPAGKVEAGSGKPDELQQMSGGLQKRIELAIDNVRRRDLETTNGFWTVFHGIIGLGPSVTLRYPGTDKRVNALDYVCSGGAVRGLEFLPTREGVDVRSASGPETYGISQGHQDQFIAEIAQWGVPKDLKFVVNGKDCTYEDFLRHTKARASTTTEPKQELSWAIVCLGQYYGTNITWTNNRGEKLRFEDLVRYELEAPIDEAACGGTHRLFGLTWVYRLHLLRGGKKEGVWKDVEAKIAEYKELAHKVQNADGSFSTAFFARKSNEPNQERRMNTTGHIFEWLSLAMTDEELKEPWMQDAANCLAAMFLDIQDKPMESGTLYHATHGLLLYYARVYGGEKLGINRPYFPGEPLDSQSFQKKMHGSSGP